MGNDHVKILIYGAGVNGSACATILHQSGIDITVLARGARYDYIRKNGIVIENPMNNHTTIAKVKVVNNLAPENFYDYIFVIMRKNQALELLPTLKLNCSPNIVFMGNTIADPQEYTCIIGKERVLMGSVYAGGRREGNIIKAIVNSKHAVPFGEIDGTITPRLEKLVATLNQGISHARISTKIVNELITHASTVAPLGYMTLKHHSNTRELAQSTPDLYLVVDAMRDTFDVIQAIGYHAEPRSDYVFFKRTPRFLLVFIFRILLNSKYGEVGINYHVSQAPDEMEQLAKEMRAFVEKSNLPVFALRKALDMQ